MSVYARLKTVHGRPNPCKTLVVVGPLSIFISFHFNVCAIRFSLQMILKYLRAIQKDLGQKYFSDDFNKFQVYLLHKLLHFRI